MNLPGSVLLVDDEPHIRKFVGLLLRQLGPVKVIEAGTGTEALAAFALERPALVLLDVNMPVMDGLETLRRLRELDPECVVIMLTSLANRQTVDQAISLGAANYLRKDTPKAEIIRALTETIAAAFADDEPAA